jgi:hypothetical protein
MDIRVDLPLEESVASSHTRARDAERAGPTDLTAAASEAIASDSGAFAYTRSAINEGYRAIQDLP